MNSEKKGTDVNDVCVPACSLPKMNTRIRHLAEVKVLSLLSRDLLHRRLSEIEISCGVRKSRHGRLPSSNRGRGEQTEPQGRQFTQHDG